MNEITVKVNGKAVVVPDGSTVAIAVNRADETAFRKSVSGEPRAPLCGMGICFECRVEIDGQSHQRACKRFCRDGMEVRTL